MESCTTRKRISERQVKKLNTSLDTIPAIVILVIALYFVLNAVIIRRFHVTQDNIEQFSVGGRKFGWLLVVFTYMGAWYVGATYTGWVASGADIGMFALYLGIYSIGGMVTMYFMASNVWIWGKVYQLNTVTDLINLRYQSPAYGNFFTVIVLLVNFFWLVVEMITIGYVFMVATNAVIDFKLGIIIGSVFVLVYTFFGGARGSAIGSVVQGTTFVIAGAIVFFVLMQVSYGGPVGLFEMIEMHKPELLSLESSRGLWMSSIITGIFGAYCWPQVFNRIYMGNGPRESKKAVLIAPIMVVIITCGILWNAMGLTMLDGLPVDHQTGLFWLANKYLGPLALGFVGVFAITACMSTISAVSHSIGVMVGGQFLTKEHHSELRKVKNMKYSLAVVCIMAIAVALFDFQNLNFVALSMYQFIIQAFVPLFFGIIWKRGNVRGAFFGMTAGIMIAMIGFLGPDYLFDWAGGLNAGCVGLVVNFVIYWICAQVYGKPKWCDELWESLKLYDEKGRYIGKEPENLKGRNKILK